MALTGDMRDGVGRSGEGAMSCVGVWFLGVQLAVLLPVGVVARVNLALPFRLPGTFLVGELLGVDCRRGDGDAGDSGRRKGELREGGVLYPRWEDLYGVVDWGRATVG